MRTSIPPALLSNSQHAYSKGRSTETALHSVVSALEKSLWLKEYAPIAFFDIEGAFKNVTPKAIAGALMSLEVDGLV